jgi:gamma-butyrobetaine dioxygenase
MTAQEASIDVLAVRCRPDDLTITWQNSSYSVYSALWLRDNDPVRRDPHTGQRLGSVADLPREPRLRSVEPSLPGHITLVWEDGLTTIYSLPWLRAYDRGLRSGIRPTRLPWMGQPAANFASCDYQEWLANPAAREDWLYFVARDGLAFLRQVPLEQGTVLRVAEGIGYIRETNYGRIFDVQAVAQPNNLAYTSLALPPHTDNPYRDPVPGFQLLHCLSTAGEGGDSIFVDGMAVAERIRAQDAEAFSTLCQIPVLFRFQDAAVDIAAERTLLEMDPHGQFRSIYYNDRSIAPLPLKTPQLKKFYPAYRRLAELLREPGYEVVCRLQPGDLVLFDNTRILHGRTAYSMESGGKRHLQGCYLDPDGLYSSLAVLARQRSEHHDDPQH